MALRFYNTLSQQVEEFSPARDNTVRMYTCGPTVYDYAHIGNFRTFTFVDILRQVAARQRIPPRPRHEHHRRGRQDHPQRRGRSTRRWTNTPPSTPRRSWRIAPRCAWSAPEHLVPATDHIDDMAEAIARLAAGHHTYTSDGSVYFRIATFPGLRQALAQRFQRQPAPARASMWTNTKRPTRATSRCGKRPRKASRSGTTAIGPGRPGWHIECSVMAIKYLGETLDIHAGGVDLIFPHHENEIAQSESLTGKPFARFWLHAEFLMVEGQKMSKSLGNYFTLRDLLGRGYQPEAIRYLLASVPYRKSLNFTFDGLQIGRHSPSTGCAISSCGWKPTTTPTASTIR